jgi:hypothetical protein
MNMLETKLRAALRETGEEISPGTVPRLHLHGRRRPGLPPVARRRWSAWLAPVAAAASVAAVVAGSLAISSTFHGHTPASRGAATPKHYQAPPAATGALASVPSFFAELTHPVPQGEEAQRAVVRSTATGGVLATLSPPKPYRVFTWVSGAANDQTFILAAQRYWNIASGQAGVHAEQKDNTTPTVFFRLTFNPVTGATQLSKLAIPQTFPSAQLAGMAVSPDGTRLAVDLRQSIMVITLATGRSQQWLWHGGGWIGNFKPMGQIFSWTANGRMLAFQQWGASGTENVLLFDTSTPPGSLASAKVILTFPGALAVMNTLLTPDGTRIVATIASGHGKGGGPAYNEIAQFSAQTGKRVLAEDKLRPDRGSPEPLWAGPAGRALVVSQPGKLSRSSMVSYVLGVLTGGKFTPIPHGAYAGENLGYQIAW